VSEPLLQVERLGKAFGARWALREVTFGVSPGEIVALIGPNGAGKTTLLRILGTLTRPNVGRVFIERLPVFEHPNAARARIGLVGHQTFLYDDLTAAENLRFYARLYDVPSREQTIRAVAERVGIAHRLNDVTRTLSRGLQQRLTIARALLHAPRVLLLDEPYTGLDRAAADALDQILLDAKRNGCAILFSTHDLERGLALCDRALVLRAGRLMHDLPRAEWRDLAGFMTLYARVLASDK
jgi:heme exporter protein A